MKPDPHDKRPAAPPHATLRDQTLAASAAARPAPPDRSHKPKSSDATTRLLDHWLGDDSSSEQSDSPDSTLDAGDADDITLGASLDENINDDAAANDPANVEDTTAGEPVYSDASLTDLADEPSDSSAADSPSSVDHDVSHSNFALLSDGGQSWAGETTGVSSSVRDGSGDDATDSDLAGGQSSIDQADPPSANFATQEIALDRSDDNSEASAAIAQLTAMIEPTAASRGTGSSSLPDGQSTDDSRDEPAINISATMTHSDHLLDALARMASQSSTETSPPTDSVGAALQHINAQLHTLSQQVETLRENEFWRAAQRRAAYGETG